MTIPCTQEFDAVVAAAQPFENHMPEGFVEAGHNLDDVIKIALLAYTAAHCLENKDDKSLLVDDEAFDFEVYAGMPMDDLLLRLRELLRCGIDRESVSISIQDLTLTLMADIEGMRETENLVEIQMFYMMNDLALRSYAGNVDVWRDALEDAFKEALDAHDEDGITVNFFAAVKVYVQALAQAE